MYDIESMLTAFIGAYLVVMVIVFLAIFLLTTIGRAGMYKKAGKSAVAAWIPFWNMWTLCDVVYGKGYLMFLMLIPTANIFFMFMLYGDLARAYGKHSLMGIVLGMFSPIAFMVFGFSKNIEYIGYYGKEGYQGGEVYESDSYV